MENAHERFGTLEFTKRMKDTTTRVRVYIDRAVLEPAKEENGQARAHLISMIGGDSEIGALWAAVTEAALLQIHLPGQPGITASLGPEAQCFRGSVAVPGRKRPGRHLVAVSTELARTKPGTDREGRRTILCDDDPAFVLYRVACRYGLPVVPEWAPWFMRELNQRKAIRPLTGLGCSPVLVSGTKPVFLKWIGKALREGLIRIRKKTARSLGSYRGISWSGRLRLQRKARLLPRSNVVRERTKEWAMIVIVKVWSTNPDYSAGCDYAVVEISEDLAKVMLRRIGVLSEQKVLDPAVCETYYWDCSPQYFSPWIDRDGESQPREAQATCTALEDTLADLEVDTCEVVTAPDDFRVLESQIAAVECSQMIVRDGGIAFTAIPKHTGIYLTTAEIPKQVLESVLTTATA